MAHRPAIRRITRFLCGTSFVRRLPPLTGERIVPRWVFEAVPVDKLRGYTIEVRINEVIAESRLPTVVRTMRGVQHRTKRAKRALHSELDDIPGIGATRKRALLKTFGSVARLRAATVDEIASTPGVGPRTARIVWEHLHAAEPVGARRAG